jgi:hypothetical protein
VTVADALDYALGYLHATSGSPAPLDDHVLDIDLEHGLEASLGRIARGTGEVTRRDVVLLVEAWILAHPERALDQAIYPAWLRKQG